MTGNGNLSIRAGKRTMASHCSPSWCDFSPTICNIVTLRINGLPLSITSNAELASCLLLSAILWALFRNEAFAVKPGFSQRACPSWATWLIVVSDQGLQAMSFVIVKLLCWAAGMVTLLTGGLSFTRKAEKSNDEVYI